MSHPSPQGALQGPRVHPERLYVLCKKLHVVCTGVCEDSQTMILADGSASQI